MKVACFVILNQKTDGIALCFIFGNALCFFKPANNFVYRWAVKSARFVNQFLKLSIFLYKFGVQSKGKRFFWIWRFLFRIETLHIFISYVWPVKVYRTFSNVVHTFCLINFFGILVVKDYLKSFAFQSCICIG